MKPTYEVTELRVNIGKKDILYVPKLVFYSGELVAVGGPNGAGKSTLLSIMSGLRNHFTGQCIFKSKDIRNWPRTEFTRHVAVVQQGHPISFPFTVEEIVLMGRMPHAQGWFETREDIEVLENALTQTDALGLRGREFRTLSGGEQQRVILASALAQNPQVLLLDEPTNYLDLDHQVQFYKLLTRLRDQGVLVIAVTHDLNLAASHADRLLLLHNGSPVADGKPEEIITADILRQVFHIDAEFWYSNTGKVWIRYGE